MISLKVFGFAALLVITSYTFAFAKESEEISNDTLKLVHLVFRHGDRANDIITTYPNDPYKNETYYPYGPGQLTNKGKQTEYTLGKKLRERYNDFLGEVYTPDVLDAVSTELDRTKASLQLVLTGLYPPKGTVTEWETDLNWQPIPYRYLPFANEHLLSFPHLYCSSYPKLYQDYLSSSQGQKIEQKYAELYSYLSDKSGLNITSTYDVRWLYFGLTTESEWGLKLPPWTKSVFPNPMEKAVIDFYKQSTATPELKQIAAGFILKKIITDTRLKVSDELKPQNRKLFLYSGHETNLAFILNTLGVYSRHIPPYGSCIIIEVHKINNVDGIKIFYEDYTGAEPKQLTIPDCDDFCPLDKFVKLMEKNVPSDENLCEEKLA